MKKPTGVRATFGSNESSGVEATSGARVQSEEMKQILQAIAKLGVDFDIKLENFDIKLGDIRSDFNGQFESFRKDLNGQLAAYTKDVNEQLGDYKQHFNQQLGDYYEDLRNLKKDLNEKIEAMGASLILKKE